jgi:hypothetical protein
MNEHEKLVRAKERVEAVTAFYIHLAVFAVVIAALFVINLNSGSNWWVQWPMFGWGLGVLLHAMLVFGRMPRFVREWQLRKIREIKEGL